MDQPFRGRIRATIDGLITIAARRREAMRAIAVAVARFKSQSFGSEGGTPNTEML
jgi:hypothetical protein